MQKKKRKKNLCKILRVITKIEEVKYITSKPVEEVKWNRKKINFKKKEKVHN